MYPLGDSFHLCIIKMLTSHYAKNVRSEVVESVDNIVQEAISAIETFREKYTK